MNQENKEIQKNQLQVDFEETIAGKNKTIYIIEQERDSAISAQMKYEKDIDNLKAEKKVALDRAERAEARYLRNAEIETKGKQQEEGLLKKLFS
jgi:hypothetical protein